ncbi:hypothetical protein EW146_g7176 [Bondarzewia mesenterica]|uniref:Uncharacterized protein n=1 Tax=Bondarzewia mesenterica TaxID=1095465 RepID=A0A4S4LLK5_9AGAM|nr:hypothetical protein EW146_g7176 [Bondarzewia mesenterica]
MSSSSVSLQHLVQIAVGTVVLHGLILNKDGSDAPLVFRRVTPSPVLAVNLGKTRKSMTFATPPERPRLDLSPPGNLQLELGSGQVGFVHASIHRLSADFCGGLRECHGPRVDSHMPLAIKIAGRARVRVDDDRCMFAAWRKGRNAPTEEEGEESQGDVKHWKPVNRPDADMDCDSEGEDDVDRNGYQRDVMTNCIDEHTQEVHGLYKEFAEFSVDHMDVRYCHIVRALNSPPGLPALPSPLLNKTFHYCLIDFDRARKNTLDPYRSYGCHESYFHTILYNLPAYYIWEPWEA